MSNCYKLKTPVYGSTRYTVRYLERNVRRTLIVLTNRTPEDCYFREKGTEDSRHDAFYSRFTIVMITYDDWLFLGILEVWLWYSYPHSTPPFLRGVRCPYPPICFVALYIDIVVHLFYYIKTFIHCRIYTNLYFNYILITRPCILFGLNTLQ